MSTDDATNDFAGLAGAAQQTASGFNMEGTHPIFSAVHSFVLAHRYGKESPWTYMNNPGLRAMDTREAAFKALQNQGKKQPVPMARPYNTNYKPNAQPQPMAKQYAPFKNPPPNPTVKQPSVTPPGHYFP